MSLIPTASQTVGPFFAFGLTRPEWSDLTAGGKAAGEAIRIEGRVTDGDGAPVPDALVELWQANATGKYDHVEDTQEKPLDPNFRGFGRCATDGDGRYAFTTIKPGPVPGRGNALQAPHINVAILARGLLKQLWTRIYFADQEAANRLDPVLSSIADAQARQSLIAPRSGSTYRFDIVLQGERETAFLEL